MPHRSISEEAELAVPPRSIARSTDHLVLPVLTTIFLTVLPLTTSFAQDADEPVGDLVLTEVPNACELLVRDDVSELLEEGVGEGEQGYDVAGFPCVYATDSGRRLILVLHLASGVSLAGTQPGIELEYCEAERVREFDGLGDAAALFRDTRGNGCGGQTLWVATDVRFRGKIHPDQFREVERRVHFVLSLEPTRDDDDRVTILREVAGGVLDRLRELTR